MRIKRSFGCEGGRGISNLEMRENLNGFGDSLDVC
jgi:hypothetical protein